MKLTTELTDGEVRERTVNNDRSDSAVWSSLVTRRTRIVASVLRSQFLELQVQSSSGSPQQNTTSVLTHVQHSQSHFALAINHNVMSLVKGGHSW